MTNSQNADLFKETLTVLSYFNSEMLNKIPNDFMEKIVNVAADSEKDFFIDDNKSLDEQDISVQCKEMIGLIYYRFIADENEKKDIMNQWKANDDKLSENCDFDKLFEDRNAKITDNIEKMAPAVKESLWSRIIRFFKKK